MPSKQTFNVNTPKFTLLFMVGLSFTAALVLSLLSTALKPAQEEAQELDRSKEMLKAAQILNHEGYFQIKKDEGEYVPAKVEENGLLVYTDGVVYPTSREILTVYNKRILPRLVNSEGVVQTFEEAGIDLNNYLREYKKTGYYQQKEKLVYFVLPNEAGEEKNATPVAYILPVNGFGLWDAIYGYIAIAPNGETVVGISWYEQKETPGLGANIVDWDWQKQFPGKLIAQPNASGKIDLETASLGIQVVRGKVQEVFGDTPKAKNAVDGMAGATLTGNGVQEAYKHVLSAYRAFFLEIHKKYQKGGENG